MISLHKRIYFSINTGCCFFFPKQFLMQDEVIKSNDLRESENPKIELKDFNIGWSSDVSIEEQIEKI